jgi:hypothetical protein
MLWYFLSVFGGLFGFILWLMSMIYLLDVAGKRVKRGLSPTLPLLILTMDFCAGAAFIFTLMHTGPFE